MNKNQQIKQNKSNYAFIDAQNLNSGLNKLGWKMDWKKFRDYLRDQYNIEVAYVFIGFIAGMEDLYIAIQKAGFVIVFKEVVSTPDGIGVKGNVDAELILQAMIDYNKYDKALIVSGDGDFSCLLRHLVANNKFLMLIAPHRRYLSSLLLKASDSKTDYLQSIRKKVEYRHYTSNKSKSSKENIQNISKSNIDNRPVINKTNITKSTINKPNPNKQNIKKPISQPKQTRNEEYLF
ncbi:NYN domain-containing protein [Candidatus Gracilibacteria bacterium]|nr:NYN domain-containing protein [Candidatus Gracilibacteria bacterium]